MATNRLDALKQMLAQDPQNAFARYGLAMEYSKNDLFEDAIAEFKAVINQDSTYVAAYYHGGQALKNLAGLRMHDSYEQGIEACNRKGDAHTRSEIEAALSLLPI